MSKFPLAYCTSMESDVSTDQVIDICTETGHIPLLQCADPQCRHSMPKTQMKAVCCDPQKPCTKMPPHFSTYPNHDHADECIFQKFAAHTEYILRHKEKFRQFAPDSNMLRALDGIADTSYIPDEYVVQYDPRDFLKDIDEEAKRQQTRHGKSADDAYRIARCIIPQRTSSLETIVDMAERLQKTNEREIVRLSLPNRQNANFANAFFNLRYLQENFTSTPYIFYAYAHIKEHQDGYLALYEYPLKNYDKDFPEIRAVTLINAAEHRPLLINKLEHYASSGKPCCIYSFSTHRLNENTCPDVDLKRCVVIEPRTRDSVVIRNRCLNRPEKSNS